MSETRAGVEIFSPTLGVKIILKRGLASHLEYDLTTILGIFVPLFSKPTVYVADTFLFFQLLPTLRTHHSNCPRFPFHYPTRFHLTQDWLRSLLRQPLNNLFSDLPHGCFWMLPSPLHEAIHDNILPFALLLSLPLFPKF